MKIIPAFALTSAASLAVLAAPAGAGPRLAAYMCQPLSSFNIDKCCSASNWRDIIVLESQHLCIERNDDKSVGTALGNLPGGNGAPSDGNGGGGGVVGGPGNPGNDKSVGRAGEKDSQGMRNTADSVGTHGMSDNPAKGGGPH
jgi:hypothetical protein